MSEKRDKNTWLLIIPLAAAVIILLIMARHLQNAAEQLSVKNTATKVDRTVPEFDISGVTPILVYTKGTDDEKKITAAEYERLKEQSAVKKRYSIYRFDRNQDGNPDMSYVKISLTRIGQKHITYAYIVIDDDYDGLKDRYAMDMEGGKWDLFTSLIDEPDEIRRWKDPEEMQ